MIRANLLPEPRERVSAFGVTVSLATIRGVALSLTVLAAVAVVTFASEWYRAGALTAAAVADETLLDQHATEREHLRKVASRVAALRAIDRVARDAARSGNASALAIVRIGNALPRDVWLDRIDHDEHRFDVGGRSQSLADVGAAVVALGRAIPERDPLLLGVDGNDRSDLRFSAQLQVRMQQ